MSNLESRLKAIRERCEAATDGPFLLKHPKMKQWENYILANCEHCDEEPFILATPNRHMDNWKNDITMLAHSRTDIPMLLELLECTYNYGVDVMMSGLITEMKSDLDKIMEKYK